LGCFSLPAKQTVALATVNATAETAAFFPNEDNLITSVSFPETIALILGRHQ
jgi:hypothetical protein